MVKTIIKPFILLLGMILIFSYTIAETNAQIREIRQPRKVSDYLSGLDLERFNRLWREGLIHHGNVQAFIDEWADAPDRARAFEHAAGRVLHKSFWKNVGKDVAGIWEGIKDPRLGSDVVREYLEGHAQKYGAWAPFTGAAGIAWSAVTTPFRAAKDIGEVAFTKRTWADIEHPLKTLIGAALAILVGSAVLRQLAKGATKAGKFRRAKFPYPHHFPPR